MTAMPASEQAEGTRLIVDRFNEALNRHDVDAVMALMTPASVFENTSPPPDGERLVGHDAVRGFWEQMFRSTPTAQVEAEDIVAAGDRCVVRWQYTWTDPNGTARHIRGIDVMRVRDGKVAE